MDLKTRLFIKKHLNFYIYLVCQLSPLYTAFLHNTKRSGYRTIKKFDEDPLAVEQNNYLRKIVNVYVVLDLDAWPRNPIISSNQCSKNSDKEKYVYNDYGITFDSVGLWISDNDSARNVIIFGVHNSSSSHDADNRKNNFLVPGERLIKSLVHQSLVLILVKEKKILLEFAF